MSRILRQSIPASGILVPTSLVPPDGERVVAARHLGIKADAIAPGDRFEVWFEVAPHHDAHATARAVIVAPTGRGIARFEGFVTDPTYIDTYVDVPSATVWHLFDLGPVLVDERGRIKR